MDLNSHTRKDFAFVRFVHEMSARRAIEALDGTVLISGRCIRCTYVPPATRYFATDHLHTDDKRRYGKVKEQKRPTGVAMLL
jgi:RNA recognition motif-containing protein